jgi:hypothetical protein
MKNKSLAVLVGVSVVLLLLGFVLFREGIFGFGTFSNANVSINLSSETSILINYNINFGSGRVNSSSTNAVLDSSLSSAINGTWNWGAPQFIYIENDGTVNISVNLTSTDNATTFVSGTNPGFMIKGITTEPNSCAEKFNTTYFEIETTSKSICGLLQYGFSEDTFNSSVRLIVPSDATPGIRTATLTFTGRCLTNCA